MKRTPLKRKKPKVDRAEQRLLDEFSAEFPNCWACFSCFDVQTHHLIAGHGRRLNELCCLGRACGNCHRATHEKRAFNHRGELMPELTLGHWCWLKFEWNAVGVDWERLREIRGRRLPDMERLPDYYLAERERSGP